MGDTYRVGDPTHRHGLEQSAASLLVTGGGGMAAANPFSDLIEDEIQCEVTQTDGSKVTSLDQGAKGILDFEGKRMIWQVQTGLFNMPATVQKGEVYIVVKTIHGLVFVQDDIYTGHTPCFFGAFPAFPNDSIIIDVYSTIGATGRNVTARVRHTPL